jgi:hypothetical protein
MCAAIPWHTLAYAGTPSHAVRAKLIPLACTVVINTPFWYTLYVCILFTLYVKQCKAQSHFARQYLLLIY